MCVTPLGRSETCTAAACTAPSTSATNTCWRVLHLPGRPLPGVTCVYSSHRAMAIWAGRLHRSWKEMQRLTSRSASTDMSVCMQAWGAG